MYDPLDEPLATICAAAGAWTMPASRGGPVRDGAWLPFGKDRRAAARSATTWPIAISTTGRPRLSANGRITPDAAQRAYTRLRQVRHYAHTNYQRYGQLTPDQQGYIQSQLDYVGRSLHWEANYGN